jgi:uncharacterized membrane protein
MPEFNTETIVAAVAGVFALVLGFGWKWLKGFVKKTDNKYDDAAVDAFESAVSKNKDEAPK